MLSLLAYIIHERRIDRQHRRDNDLRRIALIRTGDRKVLDDLPEMARAERSFTVGRRKERSAAGQIARP